MANNKIREFRLKKGLTQRQLALIIGVSQRDVQLMESGVQPTHIKLVTQIASALSTPIEQLYPSAKRAIASLGSMEGSILDDENLLKQFADAGIDADPQIWTLKYRIRNGLSGLFQIPSDEKRRLWGVLQSGSDECSFVVFDTKSDRIALNRGHLIFWQFLFDPAFDVPSVERSRQVVAYSSTSLEPLAFGVDADQFEKGESDDNEDGSQLQQLFFELETSSEADDVVSFLDEDGERVFLRSADIALLSVPLGAVEPGLYKCEIDALDEPDNDENDGIEYE